MELFIGQIIVGLSSGSIYASLALALAITYKATRIINFSQGEMAMISSYMVWYLMGHDFSYWSAFLLALVGSFLLGALIQQALIAPIEDDPHLNQIVVTIGLSLILNSVAGWFFSYETQIFQSPFVASALTFGDFAISFSDLTTFALAWTGMLFIFIFFQFTKAGLMMRAVAQNPESSKLIGIKVTLVRASSWGMAAAIGASAGILAAPTLFLSPQMMRGAIIYALAAAILGGLESPVGAAICGLFLGVLENLIGTYVSFIGSSLKLTVALSTLFIILLVKPDGIFGKPTIERV